MGTSSHQALGASIRLGIGRYGPVALLAFAGALALASPATGWRAVAIVLAGVVATASVIRQLTPRCTEHANVDQAARVAMEVLTQRMGRLSEGVLTIGQLTPRVTIDENLASLWRLPPAGRVDDPEALLGWLLAAAKDPDVLRADIARLEREPGTSIHHEVDLRDGRVFEVHAMSLETSRESALDRRSYFVFNDISVQANLGRELQFANALLQAQIEASPLGILVVDKAGMVAAHNRRFVEISKVPGIVGASKDDAPVVARFAQQTKDPDAFLARVRYLYAHPDETSDDEVIMADDRVLQRHSVPLASAGRSFGRVWFFTDVTELRRSERSAHEERDFVNVLLDSLPGYFALIDAGGRLVRWNGALRSLNGRTDADLAGSNPFTNVVEDDRAKTVNKVREAIETGSAVLEFRIPSLQGIRDLRWQGRRIMVDGEPHVLAIGVDLTETHAAEAVRRAAEKRFRDIFTAATEGILIQDSATGAFVDANPHMCHLFGYTRAEFLALDPVSISVAPRAEVLARRASVAAETSSKAINFEWLCRAKDGREFWCEFSSRHIRNFGGRDVTLMMVRDISERRAALDAITYRDRILHALTVSTAELVKASSLTGAMERLLNAIGEELGVDRLLVFQRQGMEKTAAGVAIPYGWERDGVPHIDPASMASTESIAWPDIDAWFAPLRGGVPVTTDAARATGIVGEILHRGNTRSNLLIPIFVGGAYWGHFGVDDTRAVRTWNSIEIDALTTLSGIVGAMIARDHSSRALLQSEEQFRTVSDTVLDGIIMIDTGGHIRYWNRAAEGIFGYSSTEAVGKQIHQWLAPPRFRASADRGMAGFVATGRGPILGKTVEMAAIRKDGIEIAVEFKINPMSVGSDRFAVGIARDVTARNEASAAVEHMATHDLLTDLPNRRLFIDALDTAIARSKRSGQQFAVLYLDLDRFKDVNDTLGHPVGDRLLKAVAARLLCNVRAVDIVARFGGDEFAAIQIDINDPADAAALATKIVNVLAEPFDIDGIEFRSGASLGIAVYGPDSPDAESLLAHADVALYRAKADGRGKYHFYTESMETAVRERVGLERELRAALTLGQFFIVYQPQVDLNNGHIIGIEALVRWQHPTRGVVFPGSFIPAAEKSGLIVALGAWVFREVCRQTRYWIDEGIAPPIVAVNLSALQFRAPHELEQSIAATLAEFGVAAANIELELTESVMMQATQQHRDLLVRLRSMGFRMAIDDFGTGYSSLEYLQRFHVDRIKIPQIFIQDLGLIPESATIVRATIGLAHELGIAVVAEAVETVGQLDVLRDLGCTIIQGYYYSKPLSATDAGEALRFGSLGPAISGVGVAP